MNLFGFLITCIHRKWFHGGSDGKTNKKNACHVGDRDSIPGSGRFPWRREWLLTPVFLPGESHGQRSLTGCNP